MSETTIITSSLDSPTALSNTGHVDVSATSAQTAFAKKERPMPKEPKKISRPKRIQALLKEGKSVKDICAALQCSPQVVYQTKYQAKRNAQVQRQKKEALRRALAKQVRIDIKAAKAVPVVSTVTVAPTPAPQYSFGQRLRILFTGRA